MVYVERFCKKPVVIEAVHYNDIDNRRDICLWITANGGKWANCYRDGRITIETLEGTMAATPGDWIIRGVNGEFYPCKPDIFEKSYERVVELADRYE